MAYMLGEYFFGYSLTHNQEPFWGLNNGAIIP
jgi:hypothetical protein